MATAKRKKTATKKPAAKKMTAADVAKTPRLKYIAPWSDFTLMTEAMFKGDHDVHVEFDCPKRMLKLYVKGDAKADAISKIMAKEKRIGNIVIKVQVVPANETKRGKAKKNAANPDKLEVFKTALEGNSAFSQAVVKETDFGIPQNYVVFVPKVVQFYNDERSDINGNLNTLYQTIAREIFDEDFSDDINFCTAQVEQ